MNKKTPNKIFLWAILFLFSTLTLHARNIDPDVEIKINGLVCPVCVTGVKKIFQKHFYVKHLKIDTKKQLLWLEYHSIEIHPSKIRSMVKNAGYEVSSIKWLKKKEPNRYNKP